MTTSRKIIDYNELKTNYRISPPIDATNDVRKVEDFPFDQSPVAGFLKSPNNRCPHPLLRVLNEAVTNIIVILLQERSPSPICSPKHSFLVRRDNVLKYTLVDEVKAFERLEDTAPLDKAIPEALHLGGLGVITARCFILADPDGGANTGFSSPLLRRKSIGHFDNGLANYTFLNEAGALLKGETEGRQGETGRLPNENVYAIDRHNLIVGVLRQDPTGEKLYILHHMLTDEFFKILNEVKDEQVENFFTEIFQTFRNLAELGSHAEFKKKVSERLGETELKGEEENKIFQKLMRMWVQKFNHLQDVLNEMKANPLSYEEFELITQSYLNDKLRNCYYKALVKLQLANPQPEILNTLPTLFSNVAKTPTMECRRITAVTPPKNKGQTPPLPFFNRNDSLNLGKKEADQPTSFSSPTLLS